MSLNRYHKSRSSDNVFKLLHEDKTYLDILKGNVKAAYKDQIEEETGGAHDDARQTLLQEQESLSEEDPGVEAVEDSKVDEGTPEEQEKAVEKDAPVESDAQDKEMGMKEDIETELEKELEEISIAVARGASSRMAKKAAMTRRGMMRGKGSLTKYGAPQKKKVFQPGLRG